MKDRNVWRMHAATLGPCDLGARASRRSCLRGVAGIVLAGWVTLTGCSEPNTTVSWDVSRLGSGAANTQSNGTNTATVSDVSFTADSGRRFENWPMVNPFFSVGDDGTVYAFYAGVTPDTWYVATSADGFTFVDQGVADTAVVAAYHPAYVLMPDGVTIRDIRLEPSLEAFVSQSSTDGLTFSDDGGQRYELQSGDNGRAGIWEVYTDGQGGVVLTYLGDLMGANNMRMAYSTDNGMTFSFVDDNVLGDLYAGGGGKTYVDQRSILLPDGRRRMITMKSGALYTFISDDGGHTYTAEGVVLEASAFGAVSLHDPFLVRLGDGRYRIYVQAMFADASGAASYHVVSATTQ